MRPFTLKKDPHSMSNNLVRTERCRSIDKVSLSFKGVPLNYICDLRISNSAFDAEPNSFKHPYIFYSSNMFYYIICFNIFLGALCVMSRRSEEKPSSQVTPPSRPPRFSGRRTEIVPRRQSRRRFVPSVDPKRRAPER